MTTRLMSLMTLVVATGVLAQTTTGGPIDPQRAERCAVRLGIALTGKSPTAALISSPNPQMQIDALLDSPEFIERFSRFINSTFNDTPGTTSEADSAYHLTKHVLTNDKPWKDLYVGPYDITVQNNAVVVRDDPNGLGIYRTKAWVERYAGNEENGVKLATAYRMLNNATGVKLTAAVQMPGQDFSATGRQNSACRGCHFDGWFALDRLASVLTKKVVNADDTVTFVPPTAGPQQLLGRTVSNDKDLMTALVDSEAFDFRTCRLAYQFLYGRNELSCEGPIFDRCVDAFRASGTIQAALKTVASDPAYCQ
ncbi:MAG: hypothetical protein JNM17_15630 [Archangium sp.]|nr:hypothetical protein [Archangium sp.]